MSSIQRDVIDLTQEPDSADSDIRGLPDSGEDDDHLPQELAIPPTSTRLVTVALDSHPFTHTLHCITRLRTPLFV
jgi:hypothetical protein